MMVEVEAALEKRLSHDKSCAFMRKSYDSQASQPRDAEA